MTPPSPPPPTDPTTATTKTGTVTSIHRPLVGPKSTTVAERVCCCPPIALLDAPPPLSSPSKHHPVANRQTSSSSQRSNPASVSNYSCNASMTSMNNNKPQPANMATGKGGGGLTNQLRASHKSVSFEVEDQPPQSTDNADSHSAVTTRQPTRSTSRVPPAISQAYPVSTLSGMGMGLGGGDKGGAAGKPSGYDPLHPPASHYSGPMNTDEFRRRGREMVDYIADYLDTIERRRVTPSIEPGYLADLLPNTAPVRSESWDRIMADFERYIMPGITHWQHPRFHAYFPAGNAYPSILADMLSDGIGSVGFSWAACPAYTELEIVMLDWVGKMIGLPEQFLVHSTACDSKGGGVIQGSASECVLVCLLAARHLAIKKLKERFPGTDEGILLSRLIGYCSKEVILQSAA